MAPGPTFIVRLYRRKARALTGVIEDIRSGIRIPFGSATELWSALLERSRQPERRADAAIRKRRTRIGEKT